MQADSVTFSKPYINIPLAVLPFGVGTLITQEIDQKVYDIRHNHLPKFRYHYDDYLQFAPLAIQFSMGLAGVQGRSESQLQLLTADALAGAFAAALVNGVKYSVGRLRPDNSAYNSFPSGHTATAFLGAELFDLEYGERYPYFSALNYSMAIATGFSRVLNNRHWISDVFAGAGVGILSAQLGYWVRDLIYRDPYSSLKNYTPDWEEIKPFLLTYRGSSGTLFTRKNNLFSTLRLGLNLSYLYERESTVLGSFGFTTGVFSHSMKRATPTCFLGVEMERVYPIKGRWTCGFSTYWNWIDHWEDLPEADFFSELGGRMFVDFYFLSHRSMRLFGGISGGWGMLSDWRDGEKSYRATPHYLMLELGVALQLHLF